MAAASIEQNVRPIAIVRMAAIVPPQRTVVVERPVPIQRLRTNRIVSLVAAYFLAFVRADRSDGEQDCVHGFG